MKAVIALALLSVALAVQTVRYDGHQVWDLKFSGPLADSDFNVWTALQEVTRWQIGFDYDGATIRVPPQSVEEVKQYLKNNNVAFEVLTENQQADIDAENAWHELVGEYQSPENGAPPSPDFFKDYRKIDDHNKLMVDLEQAYPQLVKRFVLGQTDLNITIYGVSIKSGKKQNNPAIYYEGGIHSNEWIAPATTAYIMYQLATRYGNDSTVTNMVDSIDWYIVPDLNIDGYVYTWSTDRNWRKTRGKNPTSTCIGTDPNRNWDNHWCQIGASKDPCSTQYCGPSAFWAKAVKASADFMKKTPRIKGFIDFHSAANMWMRPYGWTNQPAKDANNQKLLGQQSVDAIRKVHGKVYKEGPIYTIIYPASGSSADWAYDQAGVTYAYGVELRTPYMLPPREIVPQGEEIWAAVVNMAKFILEH